MTTIRRVVTNRVFLLALDELYRDRMKRHESQELLPCARETARVLSVRPVDVPVEGYYGESKKLTQYFRLMRALQAEPRQRLRAARQAQGFARLQQVTESGLFGATEPSPFLLATSRDPLYTALGEVAQNDWTVDVLTRAACKAARATDDFSLPALACLARDAVVLAALRETVVLYTGVRATKKAGKPPRIVYVWKVSRDVERRAGEFVSTFNGLFDEDIPQPCAEHARTYWFAYRGFDRILGRCVRLAYDDSLKPIQHYHWAIHYRYWQDEPYVYDFWEPEVWTTERYREQCEYED